MVIEHGLIDRVVVECVDREIAPRSVLHPGTKDIVAQHAAMLIDRCIVVWHRFGGVLGAGAKCRYLDRFRAKQGMHQLETAANQTRAADHPVYLLGCGIGCHIEILGLYALQQVAYSAAHDIGGVAAGLQ